MLCLVDVKYPSSLYQLKAFGLRIQKISDPAHEVLVQEAADLLAKESIAPVDPVKGQFVSSYFAVNKAPSPGKFRPILNLKKFNKSVKIQI